MLLHAVMRRGYRRFNPVTAKSLCTKAGSPQKAFLRSGHVQLRLLDWPDTYRNRLGDLLRLRLFFEHSERRKGVGQEQALWTWLPVQLHNYRQEVEKIVNVDEMPFESRKKLRLKLQQTLGCGPELVSWHRRCCRFAPVRIEVFKHSKTKHVIMPEAYI